ncbi:aminopeptidase N, partial [Vibrio parahaemolyticus EKP-021]
MYSDTTTHTNSLYR